MEAQDNSIRSLAGLNFLFGIWLIISPYILNYQGSQARWQSTVAGIVVAILAAARYFAPSQVWTSWVNAVIGLWMIISPFATSYNSTSAYWNQVIFGILILLVSLGNASMHSTVGRHGTPGTHHPAM